MIKVTDHVYVETKYTGANVGCVLTEQGLVLIESPMLPEDALDWREELRKVSDKEIAYLISTDHHFDHVFGNAFLTKRTIAQRIAYRGFQYLQDNREQPFMQFFPEMYSERRETLDQVEIVLPQITFSREMTLNMGDRTMALTYVGGHCPATIMIYVPEDKVLFAGDNIEVGQLSFTGEARFAPWIEMLRAVEQMEIEWIVPGHGELCGLETARRVRIYFEEMRDRVKKLYEAGAAKEEVLQRVDLTDVVPLDPPLPPDIRDSLRGDIALAYDQLERQLL
jgi:cyclase